MTNTALLDLPLIDAAQSQKHVTHNEALLVLDACVQLAVLSRTCAAPPGAPAEGDRYLVPAGASGAFSGQAGLVAVWRSGAWIFLFPRAGWLLHVADENRFLLYDGAAWGDPKFVLSELQNLALLGVGTTADASNPMSVKANAALFTAKSTAEGGTGDLRYVLNKSTAANAVSQLYQDNYSGRAETGLTGDDNFHIKVSADGAAWHEAVNIEAASGEVSFPNGVGAGVPVGFRNRLINGDCAQQNRPSATIANAGPGFSVFDRWFFFNFTGADMTAASYAAPEYGSTFAIEANGGSMAPNGGVDVRQRIEAANIRDLAGRTVTLTFFAATTVPGAQGQVFLGVPTNGPDDFSAVSYYGEPGFPLDANPSLKTLTLTVPAGATNGLEVVIRCAAAAQGTGAWAFIVGTLQLEAGPVATPFERRPFGIEMALCQRYYWKIAAPLYALQIAGNAAAASDQRFLYLKSPVTMRAPPSVALVGTWSASNCGVAAQAVSADLTMIFITAAAAGRMNAFNPAGGGISANAEL